MTAIGRSTTRRSVPAGAPVVLAWGLATDTGLRRAHNEDSLLAEAPVFAVADGMGGHSAGDLASAAVVTRLRSLVGGAPITSETIVGALREATVDISRVLDEDRLGVGTTVTGAALVEQSGTPHWLTFNVGDSRVYLFEHGALRQLTTDHSVVQELVAAGLISAADAEHHPDSNVVTRAVGFNADPAPDFRLIPVRPGSRLLVCSDGLTREVDEASLHLHLAAGLSPRETAAALVDAALASGGRDNVSVVVVDVLEVLDPGKIAPPERGN